MMFTQSKKIYDLAKISALGVDYKISARTDKLLLRNPATKRFVSVESKVGLNAINLMTNGMPKLLEYTPLPFLEGIRDFPMRKRMAMFEVKEEKEGKSTSVAGVINYSNDTKSLGVNLEGKARLQGLTATQLYNKIRPYLLKTGGIVKINVNKGDTFEDVRNAQSIFTMEDPITSYKSLSKLLNRITYYRLDYEDPAPVLLQIIAMPKENPAIIGFKDGDYNCACLPVLDYLKTLSKSAKTDNMIAKVEGINKKYFSSGINDAGLQELATAARVHITIFDKTHTTWKEYLSPMKKSRRFIYYAHNKHFNVTSNTDKFNIENLFNDTQKIEWVKREEFYNLNRRYITSHRVNSKNSQVALITPNTIYKSKFFECDKFPQCFTSGGVGRAKFLKQHPTYNKGYTNSILFDADYSGFYCHNKVSRREHIKFDQNHSYKSAVIQECNSLFRGFPSRIDGVFKFDKNSRFSDILKQYPTIINKHGLLYVDLEDGGLTSQKLLGGCKIYYENSGWYPIEIVNHWYKVDSGINNYVIKGFAYSSEVFQVDFSDFTNDQFRCFIGKAIAKPYPETWKTTDVQEFTRALYTLRERVVGVEDYTLLDDDDSGELNNNPDEPNRLYEVSYKSDHMPWQLPTLSVYTKAHQKVRIFTMYNKLIDLGIIPVSVRVDGIELSNEDYERFKTEIETQVFDIGKKLGQWKSEEVKHLDNENIVCFEELRYSRREVKDYDFSNSTLLTKEILDEYLNLPRLLHLSGSGGNGKTQWIVNLSKIFNPDTIRYCAPTHDACCELEKRGREMGVEIKAQTYHSTFGIQSKWPRLDNKTNIYVIDEASMLPAEHLILIDKILRKQFDPELQFGGKQVILAGDFNQLPPISPYTKLEGSDIYSVFTEKELTTNWRQKKDPQFYNLCQSLRGSMSREDAIKVVKLLNRRVIKTPKIRDNLIGSMADFNSMYIAGINSQCDSINKECYKSLNTEGCKIICTQTHNHKKIKIPNGRVAIVRSFDSKKDEYVVDIQDIRNGLIFKKSQLQSRFKYAMALTIHKSQGKTLKNKLIINPSRLFEENHLYVALTRATSLKNVYLDGAISMDILERTCKVLD